MGLGLRELARRIDKSPAYLVSLERAEDPPGATEETLLAITTELGLDADEVLALAGRLPAAATPRSGTELAILRLVLRLSADRQQELLGLLQEEVHGSELGGSSDG